MKTKSIGSDPMAVASTSADPHVLSFSFLSYIGFIFLFVFVFSKFCFAFTNDSFWNFGLVLLVGCFSI